MVTVAGDNVMGTAAWDTALGAVIFCCLTGGGRGGVIDIIFLGFNWVQVHQDGGGQWWSYASNSRSETTKVICQVEWWG